MSSAYYNENDAHAAGWLRNLVAAGHLPAGTVDDRSILEVEPGDLDGYDQAHFFAGTRAEVFHIKRLYSRGVPQRQIAAIFYANQSQISRIVTGKSYRQYNV